MGFRIASINQRISGQKLERVCEPHRIMQAKRETTEYTKSGEHGSMSLLYEIIVAKLLQVCPKKGKALDVASGSCVLLNKIAEALPGISFQGIDLSDSMLKEGRKVLNKTQNVKLKKADMFKIDKSFPVHSFDLVTWNLSAHHCDNEEQAVEMINKLVKMVSKNGVLFIFDLERPKSNNILSWMIPEFTHGEGRYIVEDTENSFRAAFSFKEFSLILHKSNWNGYVHYDPGFANVYQVAHTNVSRRPITRQPKFTQEKHNRQFRQILRMFN